MLRRFAQVAQSILLLGAYLLVRDAPVQRSLSTWAEYFSAFLACVSMGAQVHRAAHTHRSWLTALCVLLPQNAMVTAYSGAVLRTTHITGMSTDIGIVIGKYLRDRCAAEERRLPLTTCGVAGR
jgi:hypothetical protein